MIPTSAESAGPWTPSDVRTALSTTASGGTVMAWAWWEASGSADLDDQTTWLVISILAVIVVLRGLFSWLQTGRRMIRLRRLDFLGELENANLVTVTTNDGSLGAHPAALAAGNGFVALAGSLRYHRADCLLMRGKDVKRVRSLRRLERCEMCEP